MLISLDDGLLNCKSSSIFSELSLTLYVDMPKFTKTTTKITQQNNIIAYTYV